MYRLILLKSLIPHSFWYLFIFINSLSIPIFAQQEKPPIAQLGNLDLKNWDFEAHESIPLEGSWRFYWKQLYSPVDYSLNKGKVSDYFVLPKVWNDHVLRGETLPSDGYATFQLQITGDFLNKDLAVEIPDMYTSYTLWINGKFIAANGTPAITKESTTPKWIPFTKTFNVQKDTIDILLNISNFHHTKGGLKKPILFGSAKQLVTKRSTDVSANLVQVIGLLFLFILSLAAYFHYEKNKIFMLFSIFSLTWAVRGLFSSMYLINFWFPSFNWTLSTKIEYLTLYISLLLGVQIVGQMYVEHANKPARYISHVVNSIFILITLIAPVYLFSKLLNTYFIFAGLFMIYIVVVIITALINDKKGAGYLSISILCIIALFFYDLFSFQQLIPQNPYVTSFGYLIIYTINGIGIWYNLSYKNEPPASSDYIYGE